MIKGDMINMVIMRGRVGSDPRSHTFDDGGMNLKFSVVLPTNWKYGDDEEVIFVDCEVRGKEAEWGKDKINKGDYVQLEGYIKGTRSYVASNNETRTVLDVYVEKIGRSFKPGDGSTAPAPNKPASQKPAPQKPAQTRGGF
jgi:single-stranded DNA-binding protein